MALEIFPSSPLPGGLTRQKKWNGNDVSYDSGAGQGFTSWTQPRYEWNIPWKNINDVKQSTLADFVDDMRGTVDRFLIKDPYDYQVGSVMVVRSGISAGSVQTFNVKSYHVRVDTTYIGSLTSTLSGFVTLGTEYDYDQDTGVLNITTKNATDQWSIVATAEYFRKAHFKQDYQDTSPIWNQFSVNIVIEEMV